MKIFKPIKALFKGIYIVVDKIIVTPISKLIYKINDISKNNSGKIEKLLNRPNVLIYVSLLCAFGAFLLIDSRVINLTEKEAEIISDQPVSLIYNNEAYIVEGVPETVDITLIGSKSSIYLASQIGDHEVVLDLSGYSAGTYKVKLKYNHSVQYVNSKLDPSIVTVKISEKVSDTRSLQYDLMNENKLDKKLSVSNVKLESNDVVIKSSQEIIDSVASVKALVDASQIDLKTSGDFDIDNVPLVAYDSNGNKISNIEIVPSKVKATVTIDSYSQSKGVKITTKGEMATGFAIASLKSAIENVKIYGEKSVVDAIDNIEAVVNIDGLKENNKMTVELVTPNGIRFMSDNKTEVNITVGEAVEQEFDNISVETIGLASGLSASADTIDDRTVNVKLKGVSSVLKNEIKSDQIKVYANLSGLKPKYENGKPVAQQVNVTVKVDDNRVTAICDPTVINVIIK